MSDGSRRRTEPSAAISCSLQDSQTCPLLGPAWDLSNRERQTRGRCGASGAHSQFFPIGKTADILPTRRGRSWDHAVRPRTVQSRSIGAIGWRLAASAPCAVLKSGNP